MVMNWEKARFWEYLQKNKCLSLPLGLRKKSRLFQLGCFYQLKTQSWGERERRERKREKEKSGQSDFWLGLFTVLILLFKCHNCFDNHYSSKFLQLSQSIRKKEKSCHIQNLLIYLLSPCACSLFPHAYIYMPEYLRINPILFMVYEVYGWRRSNSVVSFEGEA